MGDTGFVKFPTCLDPRAEEFHPITHITASFQQIYYPYYPQPITDLHLTTNINGPPPFYNNAPPLPPPLPTPSMSPTRTLLLSSVPTDVSESEVRRDLEVFGDVRAVEMGRVRDGIVTVHFYDLRDAQRAAVEIRRQHMRQQGRIRAHYDAVVSAGNFDSVVVVPPVGPGVVGGHAVWAQFKYPVGLCGVTDGVNHGTIVVFNLDDGVNTAWLKQTFEAFGPVKELRETPSKRHQRFIEFYDVRHASRARTQMNGKEINGKQIVIEFSRPGGHIKKSTNTKSTHQTHSLKTVHSPPHHHYSKPNPNSLPPPRFSPQIHGGGGGAGGGPDLPLRFYDSKTQFKSKKGGNCKGNSNGFIMITNESDHGNCKGVKKSLKKGGESNNGNGGGKKLESTRKVSGGSKMFLKGRSSQGKSCLDPRFLINEGRVVSEMDCKDSRTTVMIKNIPNKYSQKLLLNMLDNHCIHCNDNIADDGPLSSYDFVYLPIDFINKCNVGYGFVNMTSPQATLRLYKAFHLQNWEVFNSKKICEVTYARLQGVEALKEHFKNSKFPGEADEYLPVIFSPPRDGSQLTEPTPVVNLLQSPSAVSCSSNSSSKETNDDNDVQPEQEEEVNGGINNNGCHSNDGFGGGDNDVDGGGSDSCSSTTPNGCDNGHDPYDQ